MLDSIIVLIIACIAFIGYKTGFIKTACKLGSSIISLIIAFTIYPIMISVLKLTPLYTNINNWNYKMISSLEMVSGLQAQADIIHKASSWLPSFIGENMIKNNNPEVYKMMGVSNIAEYVSTYMTDICIRGLAIVITWFVVKLILMLFIGTLDIIAKLPVISTANKIGGLALGTIEGLLIICLFFLVVPFISTLPVFSNLQQMIESSFLGKFFYENNLILNYLQQLFI